MDASAKSWSIPLTAILLVVSSMAQRSEACGGFFCQAVTINQTAEQIIFHQDGEDVTVAVLIQYQGAAEDFSWVVPVPSSLTETSQLSTGSDLLFQSLEPASRAQFTLEVTGEECPVPLEFFADDTLSSPDAEDGASESEVQVLSEGIVGPFETQIIASSNAEALLTFLEEGDYDVTENGRELIEDYVAEGMHFVALRLTQDQGVGDLRPLVMRYTSQHPMIPLRLTAVAADPNMGVIVWILGESRAIPLNYLHVEPNYTLLNWYAGQTNAYLSYQGLITAAMDEAGGQGFATEYAGASNAFDDQLPAIADYEQVVTDLQNASSTTAFYESLIFSILPNAKVTEILGRQVPLSDGLDESFIYSDANLLIEAVGESVAVAAQEAIIAEVQEGVVNPLQESLDIIAAGSYMTRMYTTISAEEMTLDPEFAFNVEEPDQPTERVATLALACDAALGSTWTLTLGPGTGRDGEMVIDAVGESPFFGGVPSFSDQPNVFTAIQLKENTGEGDVEIDNTDVDVFTIFDPTGPGSLCGFASGICGSGSLAMLLTAWIGLSAYRRRQRMK